VLLPLRLPALFLVSSRFLLLIFERIYKYSTKIAWFFKILLSGLLSK
jgi:hypothetical protein